MATAAAAVDVAAVTEPWPNTMFHHILCVYPYRRTRSSKTSFPPLGLEYVAASLRPHAERIDLVNFRHERTPSTQPFLRPETDLVCYSINWRENLELIRDDILKLPAGVLTILGGRMATENPRYWMETCPNVDAVVCGDGEQAIAEIAEGHAWSEVAGLVYRADDGQLVFNSPRANAALDDNLMPARELRRNAYYLTSKGVSTGIRIDQVAGSRGCPFQCKFCNFAINPWGVKRHWTPRSAESIVREIERIDADLILFVDDVFTYQPDRVAEICDMLVAKKIRKHYIVNARMEIADRPDVLGKMERAGFVALLIGVESTQDATLKSMGKGFNVEQIRQRFAVLRKSKMIINAYFIVGNIGESEEQMLSIAPFARSIGVDLIHVSRLRNEPYSGLRELVEQTPGYHIDSEGFVYSDTCSPEHIADLRKQIDRRFHSPLHVAGVVLKLAHILNWRVKIRALLTIPVFLTLLIVTQAQRKLRKRMGKSVAPHELQ
ncbi:MAG: B12-binding domain-containing radical SAM protein [Planctomycetaceae bacterium]|nr:B12-binding domain-containing radical SAM protein [Planctomycetaceae bacterium]